MCRRWNCLVINDHERPVNVYRYYLKDGHRSDIIVHDPQIGQMFILITNQAIPIDGLINHLLCPMQCSLNGIKISEVPKFLA